MKTDAGALLQAIRDAGELRCLDGGGVGCFNEDDRPTDRRKLYHHLTFYGFALCFASTCVAALYDFAGASAPYAYTSVPVLLGTVGGASLTIGTAGLLWLRRARDRALSHSVHERLDAAFAALLMLTGATGLLLLALRGSTVMGLLLIVHLGIVLALFVTLPYGKFVHGLNRLAALTKYRREQD